MESSARSRQFLERIQQGFSVNSQIAQEEGTDENELKKVTALSACQLVFLIKIIFFSHNKSAGTVFRFVFSTKRTVQRPVSWRVKMVATWKFGRIQD